MIIFFFLHTPMHSKPLGIEVVPNSTSERVVKESDGTLTIHFTNGTQAGGFDQILNATGRYPLTSALNLDKAGVNLTKSSYIDADEYQNTSASGIYALGDVCGKVELTPMAIAAGRRLADR